MARQQRRFVRHGAVLTTGRASHWAKKKISRKERLKARRALDRGEE